MGEAVGSAAPRGAGAPVRVLVLTKGLGRGGAERLLVDTARRLDPARWHVEVAYLLPWKDALVSDLETAGVRVHLLDGAGIRGAGWVRRLRRLVRDGRVDLVHTHMPLPAAVARAALPGDRPRFVHTEHNLWARYRPATRWANRVTYGRNVAVIAVSEAVAAAVRASGTRVPVETVVHGTDVDAAVTGPAARARARTAIGLAADDLVVGTVGNLTAKKDQSGLLAAAARLAPELPRLRIVVVGAGPLERELADRAAALGLADRTLFLGSRGDVRELLPAFDVFALSSRYEGLPIALLEALAAGVPAVATRVGGVPEVLGDGDAGLLVAPGDPAALADALRRVLTDRGLRAEMGTRAVERARAFSIDPAVERIAAVYERALHGARSEAEVLR